MIAVSSCRVLAHKSGKEALEALGFLEGGLLRGTRG